MIILRSKYNEEERENMENLSKDRNPKKQSSPPVDANFSLPKNYELLLVLLCVIMRRRRLLFILIFH